MAAPEPHWLTAPLVEALHEASLARFGGASGLRDRGLLESALARAQHRHAYAPDADLAALAATVGFGLIRNHPFVDGNKRTGLLAVRAFLFGNGLRFEPPEAEAVSVIREVAAGGTPEAAFAEWVRAHTQPA